MSFNQIQLYSEFILYGKPHKVVSIDPPYVWVKRTDGEDQKYRYTEIVTHPTFIPSLEMKKEKAVKPLQDILGSLNEKKRETVSKRYEIILPFLLLEKTKEGDLRAITQFYDKYSHLILDGELLEKLAQETLMKRIIKETNKSRATIMRFLRAYRNSESKTHNAGLAGLISNSGKGYTGRKDNKTMEICHPKNPQIILDTLQVRLSEERIAIVKKVIENEYLNKYRVSKAKIHNSINNKCIGERLTKIPYTTVSNIIDRIDSKAKERLRNMKKASAVYDDVARGYAERDALYPLDIIQVDHTQLDLEVVDDVTGLNIGRPWITLGIDVYDRMPWCLYISFESPSANVVRKAIQHGVFSKKSKSLYDTENEWECFGIPNIIYVDNGMDFKSTNIHTLVKETLKSEIMHRPVRTPNYGAVIERLFGTINSELIHNILGTTKSNIFKKGEINSEKDACLTLKQVRKILMIYLTDYYPYKNHKGLQFTTPASPTPMIKFIEGVKETGYPEWIDKNEEERYRIEFLPTLKRPYTRDGLRWDNRLYKSEECNDLIGKRETKYNFKYDVDDISKIYLLHPTRNEYIELLSNKPSFEELVGVNQYTYKKIIKIYHEMANEKKKQLPGDEQFAEAARKMAKEIEEGLAKKRVRKTLERTQGALKISVTSALEIENSTTNKSVKVKREEELYLAAKKAEEQRRKRR